MAISRKVERRAGGIRRSGRGLAVGAAIAAIGLAGGIRSASAEEPLAETEATEEVPAEGAAGAAADEAMPAAQHSIADLAWMSGHWVYEEGDRRTEELWMDATDNMILGLSRTTVAGQVGAFEFLRVQLMEDGSIEYRAQPGGREATPFVLTEVTGTRAVFENPEHDFPQRVIYERDGKAMSAKIEGKQGDRIQSLGWSWTLAE